MGKKLRVLTVVDIFSKFSPVVDPRFNYRAEDVVRTLERVCGEIGYPKTIRVDLCGEIVSRNLDLWTYANDVMLDFSRLGKPPDNAFIPCPTGDCSQSPRGEAFNSKVRSECLNALWFMSLDDARSMLEDWRRYYNEERPHSGIGQMTPILLHKPGGASSPSLVKEAENSSLR